MPWLIFTLATCTPVPFFLLASLERPWIGVDAAALPAADAIVSLGGAGEPSSLEASGFHFTRGADRLMTAVNLACAGKADALVVGGGGFRRGNDLASEADAAKAWIESLDVVKIPIVSLGVCADTHDEAVKVAALAVEHGWKSVMLVTSASHMRRAEAAFRKAGVEVSSAPCNFLSPTFRNRGTYWFQPPGFAGPEAFFLWFHEKAGWWVYRWRGWV